MESVLKYENNGRFLHEWSEEMLCGTRTKSSVSQEEFLLLVLAESLDTCR